MNSRGKRKYGDRSRRVAFYVERDNRRVFESEQAVVERRVGTMTQKSVLLVVERRAYGCVG